MSNKTLESKIHDLIKKLYKAEYKGSLEVGNKNGIYTLKLGVPSPASATQISLQTDSEKEFLDYLEKELRNRDYMRVHYYSIKRKELERNEIKKRDRNRIKK